MKDLEKMTENEKLLRKIVIDLRNWTIGGLENSYLDNKEDFKKDYTKNDIVEEIYNEVMNGKEECLFSPIRNIGIEKKHIHFMGKEFVRELIEDRVESDFNKNGWIFPNNYYGK